MRSGSMLQVKPVLSSWAVFTLQLSQDWASTRTQPTKEVQAIIAFPGLGATDPAAWSAYQ